MKKYINRTMLVLVVLAMLASCKKDNKDNTASIAGKTWWGKFAYTGKPSQYYSIYFDPNGSFTWSEVSGDYPGQWVMNDNHLTITFSPSGRFIKADISADNKLANIQNNSTYGYTVDSGELIANPNKPVLDNTVWNGYYAAGVGYTLKLNFQPGLKFTMQVGTTGPVLYQYTRSTSGVVIRGLSGFFGIIQSETEIKGTDSPNLYAWQVTK